MKSAREVAGDIWSDIWADVEASNQGLVEQSITADRLALLDEIEEKASAYSPVGARYQSAIDQIREELKAACANVASDRADYWKGRSSPSAEYSREAEDRNSEGEDIARAIRARKGGK